MSRRVIARHSVLGTQYSVLALVILLQLALGAAFAVRTPKWQAPDEPAHYNYVRDLAEGRGLPIMQVGDWDNDYLERIKAAKFPDEMSIDGVRYESYQPPLFYLLAAPVYKLFSAAPLDVRVVALRLVSTALGAGLLVLAYAVARRALPGDRYVALAVPLFIATLPQHLAVSGSIGNDLLAETVLAGILLLLVGRDGRWRVPALGVLLGLALLTKVTIYFAVGLVAVGLLLPAWRAQRLAPAVRQLVLVDGIALAVSGWWFVRNAVVYGAFDLIGEGRHDLVVVGQPRTVYAWSTLVNLATITFHSFWAQLGWMGVPADDRVYSGLFVLTAVALVGAVLYLFRNWRSLSVESRGRLGLLGLTLAVAVVQLGLYNLKYFQAQGRYLFPGLIPIALLFGLGVRQIATRRAAAFALVGLLGLMLALDAYALTRLIPPLRPTPGVGGQGSGVVVGSGQWAVDSGQSLSTPEPDTLTPTGPNPLAPFPEGKGVASADEPKGPSPPVGERPGEGSAQAPTPAATAAPTPAAPASRPTSIPSPRPGSSPPAGERSGEGPVRKDLAMDRTTDNWQPTAAELTRGQLDGLRLDAGAIVLAPGPDGASRRGVLLSPIRESAFPFDNAVLSWNAGAPAGTALQFELQARIDGTWSGWYAMGRWSENEHRSVPATGNEIGKVEVDTLKLWKMADALRFRVTFEGTPAATPALRAASVVYADLRKPPKAPVPPLGPGWARDLPVPQFSQLEQDPAVRTEICSPTSLAMVLNYWGAKKSVPEVLAGVYDQAAKIWGNWPFNTGYAASLGLEAQVDRFTSLEQVQNEIAAGRPVILSVRYQRGQLDNTHLLSTNGHLIVVRGFTPEGDVIVNDPYSPDAASVRHVYQRAQVASIWLPPGGIVYLLRPASPGRQ